MRFRYPRLQLPLGEKKNWISKQYKKYRTTQLRKKQKKEAMAKNKKRQKRRIAGKKYAKIKEAKMRKE